MAESLDDDAGSATAAAFANFMRQRAELNGKLEEARREIDGWFQRQPMPPPLSALARLEVLLMTRRDLLAELIKLDDAFMVHLVQLRQSN